MSKQENTNKKSFRLWIQIAWTALSNGYLFGFLKGKIWTGRSKAICVPGLNCYSCPGALGSCPIGSLQATLSGRQFSLSFYVVGFIMLFGSLFGRLACGFLCPFGLVQDLLYKIPFPVKRKNLPGHDKLKYLKYFVLGGLVILLPSLVKDATGLGDPWFCEYICPSGTLGAGIPLILADSGLASQIGWKFFLKVSILVILLLSSIVVYRPFCKYLCPLGGLYGLFNPVAFYRFRVDPGKCTGCGACRKACRMDIPAYLKPNSVDCIRCGDCKRACPNGAITNSGVFSKLKERTAGASLKAKKQKSANDL